jgi:ankyrin repeat protein
VLLRAGADVNAIGGEYGTAVQAAAWAEDLETVRLLLDAGADIVSETSVSGYYGTALQAAAAAGCMEIVEELLERGAIVNLPSEHGTFGCALSAAVVVPSYDVAKLLIEHQADVNFQGGYHHLPIMAAAQSGDLLLEHGADASGQGGMWGTTISAAAYGENKQSIELLIEHGADVRAKGGHYGSALQAAVVRADMPIIEYLLDHAVDLVNYRDGKYHTALIAASYFDRLDVVTKLLDSGADFRFQGGQFRSVITAAAIKGNKALLEKFIKMGPPDYLLDEALVEACAHRQSTSVDILLKAGANVNTRHPTLGSPSDAMEAPEAEDENSDDEEDIEDEEDEEEEEEDEDSVKEDDGSDDHWEGDNGSVSGETEDGSVTDLQLEEEVTEEAKIHKLLEEARARCKRNPSVKRFRTVRHRQLPQSLSVGPPAPSVPRLPHIAASYEPYRPLSSNESQGLQYAQHSQEPWSLPYRSGPNSEHQAAPCMQPSYASPSNIDYAAQPAPLVARKQVPSPSELPRRESPQNIQQGQYPFPPSQAERQYSAGSASNVPRTFTPPSRKGSEDHALKRQSKAVNRKSIVSPGPVGKHQQRQPSYPSPQVSMDRSIGRQDFAGASQPAASPTAPYNSYTAQHQYPPPLQPRQSQQFNQPQYSQQLSPPPLQPRKSQQFNQPQYSQQPNHPQNLQQFNQPQHSQQSYQPQQIPHQAPPSQYPQYVSSPMQGPGYNSYEHASPKPSPAASVQSNLYADSISRGSQSSTWDTPTSSQASGFRSPEEAQARRWGAGGYDGDGYGR